MLIPVLDKSGNPLMPMHAAKARKLIKTKEATPFWHNGVWTIRLNREPSDRKKQDIIIGIDPGSKKEGFTIMSKKHTYKNVQADACDYVSKKVEKRANNRKARRNRKVRNRKCRLNRLANKERVPAGTRARWDWKLRLIDFFRKLYPINKVIVEDIKATTKEGEDNQWNKSFSPLEVGKRYFAKEILKRFGLHNCYKIEGHTTSRLRKKAGLEKLDDKLSSNFYAHCIDSHVIACSIIRGTSKKQLSRIENTDVFEVQPINIQRRCLHRENHSKGAIRSRYGGTQLKNRLTKNTLIKHVKHGITRLSGINAKGLFSIYNLEGKRITTGAKEKDFKVLRKLNFNYRSGISSPS